MTVFLSKAREYLLPVLAVAAAALMSYGTALIYKPAGYITGGFLLLLIVIDARR